MRPYAWSFVDQGCSSITNLGLSIVAARVIGASGLGAILVGFSGYLLALGVQRALVTDPLLTSSSSALTHERQAATRHALTCCIAIGIASMALFVLGGRMAPGLAGRGTLAFAPWVSIAVLQDFYRAVLFRDGRPMAAAVTDFVWLVVSAALAPLVWLVPSVWMPSACWGLGALAGTASGVIAIRVHPSSPAVAFTWFRSHAWPFGRWLMAESTAYNGSAYVLVWVLTAIIGVGPYGGLRASQSIFAPLSLLAPLIAMPGLPAVSRALGVSVEAARRIAMRLSGALFAMTFVFVVAAASWPSLLGVVFGADFNQFHHLIWPVGLAQVAGASSGSLLLLVKAQRRGRILVILRLIGSGALIAFSIPFAYAWGADGAAWAGLAGAVAFALATIVVSDVRPRRLGMTPAASSQ